MRKEIFVGAMLLCTLSACESYDVKSTLGLKKPAPDEFMVISNPPLSTPPDFTLTQPGTESQKRQHIDVISEPISKPKAAKNLDSEDTRFLEEFDKPHTLSEVQKNTDAEHLQIKQAKKERGIIRSTVSKINSDKEPLIDPIKEKARIKANAEAGKPINEGDVKMQSQSTLERIFN